MDLNKVGSRGFVVNFLSDKILMELGKNSSSIVEVIDCINFFVIKGKTSSEEVLDLQKIFSDVEQKYSKIFKDIKLTHTIDLLEYGCKLDPKKNLSLTLYNTQNCSYSKKQIDLFLNNDSSVESTIFPSIDNGEKLSYCSEFPYGYSLNQGRQIYYMLKNIFYSIPSNYILDTVTLILDLEKKGDDIIDVYDHNKDEYDKYLKSMILDHVDFNLEKITKEFIDIDWSIELLSPLEEYDHLKTIKYGMVSL